MNRYLNNKWAVTITAGILLGLSFPPVNMPALSLPAFMLLFHLADLSAGNRELTRYAYVGFVIWNLITTYWLMMASAVAGVTAILANAALMCIPLVLARIFSQKFQSGYLIAFLQAAAWVAYEYLHHHWDLAWPWLAVGNAWSNKVSLIQYISVTGHLGITFWVLLSAALAYQSIKLKKRTTAYAAVFVLLIFPIVSLFMYAEKAPAAADTIEVAVIQPNHDSYQSYGGMSGLAEVTDSLLALTERTITPNTSLVVWPENAIDSQIYVESRTSFLLSEFAANNNLAFIVGTGLIELYDTPPKLYRGTIGGKAYNIFNSALYVDKNGQLSYYNKANLVPIVERVPFLNFLATIDIFGWVDWGRIGGFGKGTTAATLNSGGFITGGLVCYDSVYPAWVRKFIQNDAGFITIITNDGWWGNTSGHHQHFAYARLRAIEFNRWVVRSANNGLSGIIDTKGNLQVKTNYWQKTSFTYNVPVLHTLTFYARYGDWLSYLCLVTTFLFTIYTGIISRRKSARPNLDFDIKS